MNKLEHITDKAPPSIYFKHFKPGEFEPGRIHQLLLRSDQAFVKDLCCRVDIQSYTNKLSKYADIITAESITGIVALSAFYLSNNTQKSAFITHFSVAFDYQGQGIASELLEQVITHCLQSNFTTLELEVNPKNIRALNMYIRHNFIFSSTSQNSLERVNSTYCLQKKLKK